MLNGADEQRIERVDALQASAVGDGGVPCFGRR
jgi:hypothetical protein